MTDPIADMLTRIRNANQMRYDSVKLPSSKTKVEVARILKEEGYIRGYEVEEVGKFKELKVHLKYGRDNERVITGIQRTSKPGLRVYAQKNELPRVLSGLGIAIVSTSKGMMTDREARKQQIGGEVIAYVW